MTAYSIPTLVMASICSTVALYEFLSWTRRGGKRGDLAFALTGLGAAAYCVGCCGQYSVDIPSQSVPWLKLQVMSLLSAGLAFLWYVSEETGLVRKAYLKATLAGVLLCGASQFADLGSLGWIADRPIVTRVSLPFGLEFVYKLVAMGPLNILEYAWGLSIIAYITWTAFRYRRSGKRREARVFLIVLGFFCLALTNDVAVALGLYSSLNLIEYAWLLLLLVVGLRRSSEARDALATRRALEESERRLRESQATMSAIVDSTPDLIWSVDSESFGLLSLNSGAREYMAGRAGAAPRVGMAPEELASSEEELRVLKGLYARALAEGPFTIELSPGGGTGRRIMQFSLSPLARDGKAFGVSVFAKDITERKEAEEQIARSLVEKETLLRELYHRTKNNMNVIVSMLRLQANHTDDEGLRAAFSETEARIMSMSLVHEKLYESSDLTRIDLKAYIEDLAERLLRNYALEEGRISLVLELEEVDALIDTAVSCGLIVNELASNSLKYAFPGGRKGRIRIELRKEGESGVRLSFSDDGVGLPPGFDPERDGSLGMKIVMALARGRLKAEVAIRSEGGFSCRMLFSEGEAPSSRNEGAVLADGS